MKRILFGLLLLLFLAPDLLAQGTAARINEWLVPWEQSRPRDPYVDQQGRVWFVGQRGNYVAYLEPGSGEFKRYELDANTLPHNLIVDEEGSVWYAGNAASHIGKLDPATGAITKFPMPDPAARDPHTLVFDNEGDIWFTVQGGNMIGRLMTETGKVDLVKVPAERSRPYGIKVDAQNRPWVVLFGTNKIATVNPQTLQLETYDIPRAEARPRRMEVTADGNVWYVDHDHGMLGRFNPRTEQFKEWALPGGEDSRPYGTAADDQGRLWIAETGAQPNRIVGFDPETEQFFSTTNVPSGGGTVRHMYFHPSTKEIWYGADTNYIGRVRSSGEAL